jgi:nicotinamidase-related amidase
MSGNYGYKTYLISDATATFDRIGINDEKYDSETIHLTTLANLNEEFATVLDSNELMSRI